MKQQSAAEFLRSLNNRIAALEAERDHLIALRRMYVGEGEDLGGGGSAPVFPPVPAEKMRRLVRNSSGQTGSTPLILEVAREHPGLVMSQLVTRIFDYVTSDSQVSRQNIRDQIRYLVSRGRLERRAGQIFVVDESGKEEAENGL